MPLTVRADAIPIPLWASIPLAAIATRLLAAGSTLVRTPEPTGTVAELAPIALWTLPIPRTTATAVTPSVPTAAPPSIRLPAAAGTEPTVATPLVTLTIIAPWRALTTVASTPAWASTVAPGPPWPLSPAVATLRPILTTRLLTTRPIPTIRAISEPSIALPVPEPITGRPPRTITTIPAVTPARLKPSRWTTALLAPPTIATTRVTTALVAI